MSFSATIKPLEGDDGATMRTLHIPQTIEKMTRHLEVLHAKRSKDIRERKEELGPRRSLTATEREEVLKKTDKRCHLCGGKAIGGKRLVADHVLPHASGGKHKIDNYLAAHGFCNRKRWMYSPEEFQLILKLGVWGAQAVGDAYECG
jgi:5-methylcytosine-specific restriction endonuclease McrA